MTDQQVTVIFTIPEGQASLDRFMASLQKAEENDLVSSLGFRAGDMVDRREALTKFTEQMELVLRRHDHKQSWRTDPIEMLVRKLKLELAEFEVAYDFERWDDARNEAVDLANFCLIVFDRLSQPDIPK